MILPTLENILSIHKSSIARFGGVMGILNKDQLRSFIAQLHQAIYFGQLTKIETAAWIFVRLIQNHYFVDGNKRTGLATMLNFLKSNSCNWNIPTEDFFYNLTINIASHDGDDILDEIRERLQSVIKCE